MREDYSGLVNSRQARLTLASTWMADTCAEASCARAVKVSSVTRTDRTAIALFLAQATAAFYLVLIMPRQPGAPQMQRMVSSVSS